MRFESHRPVLALVAAATFTLALAPRAEGADPASEAFHRLLELEGTWTGHNDHGQAITLTYASVAGGSALLERYHRAGEPAGSEMVTVYHLDGDTLMLDHYCIAGNQPRMRSAGADDDGSISFELDGITNLETPGAGHMGRARVQIQGDTLESRWTFFQNQEPAFEAVIQARRVDDAPEEAK